MKKLTIWVRGFAAPFVVTQVEKDEMDWDSDVWVFHSRSGDERVTKIRVSEVVVVNEEPEKAG